MGEVQSLGRDRCASIPTAQQRRTRIPAVGIVTHYRSFVIDEILGDSAAALLAAVAPRVHYAASPMSDGARLPQDAHAACLGYVGSSIRGALTVVCTRGFLLSSLPEFGATLANDTDFQDWTGELANQLLGRVKNRLLRRSVELRIATPVSMYAHVLQTELLQDAWLQFRDADNSIWVRMDVQGEPGWTLPPVAEAADQTCNEGDFILF